MIYQQLDPSRQTELAALFTSVFSDAEGEPEGKLIGQLASTLAANIDHEEILCFGACDNDSLCGAIFFTRLRFRAPIQVFMLSPVAVSTLHQGLGVGQAMIRTGLKALQQRGIDVAVTYGDPAYYSKVGFQPLPESTIQAPQALSMPFGWLGQALTDADIPAIQGCPECVKAFNDPALW